jgi:hypothetical protein
VTIPSLSNLNAECTSQHWAFEMDIKTHQQAKPAYLPQKQKVI